MFKNLPKPPWINDKERRAIVSETEWFKLPEPHEPVAGEGIGATVAYSTPIPEPLHEAIAQLPEIVSLLRDLRISSAATPDMRLRAATILTAIEHDLE